MKPYTRTDLKDPDDSFKLPHRPPTTLDNKLKPGSWDRCQIAGCRETLPLVRIHLGMYPPNQNMDVFPAFSKDMKLCPDHATPMLLQAGYTEAELALLLAGREDRGS